MKRTPGKLGRSDIVEALFDMSYRDLVLIDEMLHKLLEDKDKEEILTPNSRQVIDEKIRGGLCLRLEKVNCGKCKRCRAGGYHHGPYWYGYFSVGKKMKSVYIGKS